MRKQGIKGETMIKGKLTRKRKKTLYKRDGAFECDIVREKERVS